MRVATAVVAAVVALVLAGCGDDEESATTEAAPAVTSPRPSEIRGSPEQKIEQTGEAWAPLFARDGVAACRYMFAQPVCEEFFGRDGEPPEVGDPSGFQESFANATVERVEVEGHKAGAEFSNGELVEFIQETDEPRSLVGAWFILDVGGNAGKKYFEPPETTTEGKLSPEQVQKLKRDANTWASLFAVRACNRYMGQPVCVRLDSYGILGRSRSRTACRCRRRFRSRSQTRRSRTSSPRASRWSVRPIAPST